MTWRVGRFVRGLLDEDVASNPAVLDAVFDHDRLAAALAELERSTTTTEERDPMPLYEVHTTVTALIVAEDVEDAFADHAQRLRRDGHETVPRSSVIVPAQNRLTDSPSSPPHRGEIHHA